MVAIRVLDGAEVEARVDGLGDVLLDCVAGGASVSFMADMTRVEAQAFWRKVADGARSGRRVVLVAEEAGRVLGTVQVVASGIPNQPHRADLSKMLVHRDGRRRGLGRALLVAAEAQALARGWWLLVLDTVTDSEGDRLYAGAGWTPVGVIPDFALWPDGGLCATRYFYRDLRPKPDIVIARERPDQPEILALIEASDAYSAALYPADSNHMIDVGALMQPSVRFFVARRGGTAVGCGAVVLGEAGAGELKRFFVDEAARGAGLGHRLLAAVEAEATSHGVQTLRLETGIYSAPAIALYRRAGYRPREAFPPYAPDPFSLFMEKRL